MASSKSYSDLPLFESNGKKITYTDFAQALDKLGIKKNDTIFVHSDMSSFGRLKLFDRVQLCRILVEAMKDAIPNGNLIMPAFSYSFEANEPFDVLDSKSKVGVLSEFFRTMANVRRTVHPNHSVCILGNDKDLLKIDKDTFGDSSIFGKLRKKKGKILFFGAPFQSLTFIHHIEQMQGVPYRKHTKIKGIIIAGKKKYEDTFGFYSKYSYFFTNLKKLENHLLDTKAMKTAKVGNGMLMVIDVDDLFDEGTKLLDKNIYYFVKDTPWPFFVFNHLFFKIIRFVPGFADMLDRIASKFIK